MLGTVVTTQHFRLLGCQTYIHVVCKREFGKSDTRTALAARSLR